MADNTKIGPIFRGANGGLSDDIFTGIQNSFYYSQNLEIREDMRSIYPCPQAKINKTVSGIPTKILQYSTYKRAVFTDGKVYDYDSSDDSISSPTSIGNVKDAEIFGDKIFVTTSNKLYSFSKSSPNRGSPTTVADLNSCDYHPLQATSTILAVGDKNKIKVVLYNALGTAVDQITMSENCTVKLLDYLGGYVRIVIEKSFYRNEIGLWDASKDAINERIPMDGYNFYQSVVYKGSHYLISNKGLGILNGYQYYIIKRFNKFTDNLNSICVYDDKLYIGGTDGIYIYGAKNKNYNEVLAMWTYLGEECGALASNYESIMCSKSGKVGIDTNTATTGELQTMGYYGTSLSEIKQAEYVRIGYKIPTGGYVKVYYKTDAVDWTELTSAGGLTSTSNMRSPFATSLKMPSNARFQWIQFKFELSGVDTHVYSADLYYNVYYD